MNLPQAQIIVKHPAFERGRTALALALQGGVRGQIIFVVGLSGVGKSEIRYAVMRSFAGKPCDWKTGHIPAIAVRAAPSDRSNFSPKEFMTRLYLELLEPNVSWALPRSMVNGPDEGHFRIDARLKGPLWQEANIKYPENRLRSFVERMATARGLRAIFIEEAASMTYTHSSKNPGDHMVNYMCLAEEIDATLILFGVPRMAALWEGNAEIQRRSRFVFVERYEFGRLEDRQAFERLAVTVTRSLRFARRDLLRRGLNMAYASSVGVFGELTAYYRRADDLRSRDGASAITWNHLKNAVSTNAMLETLQRDADAFDRLKMPANIAVINKVLGK